MSTRTLRWLLVVVGALGLGRAHAQSGVVWEQMPLFSDRPSQEIYDIGWLDGDGTADPSLDTLVVFQAYGVFRYNPGQNNGEWGVWRRLCTGGCSVSAGLVSSDGTLLRSGFGFLRSTNLGQTWETTFEAGPRPLMEATLPWLRDLSGGRAVIIGAIGGAGEHARSLADGEAGSWVVGAPSSDFPESLGEVPPSPALPMGRLLHNGTYVMYSNDGAMTWQLASLGNQPTEGYLAFRFAFYPIAGHPYNGAVFGIGCEYVQCDSAGTTGTGEALDLYRSDDGGASWSAIHAFTAAETGLPRINGISVNDGVPHVGPDGALWAGIGRRGGGNNPGRIMRSTDEGLTWHRADAGLAEANNGLGWRVYKLYTARDGRMYAATDEGVWRTVQPVVSAEALPPPAASLTLAVAPNPSSGRVTLSVEAPRAVGYALVDVFTPEGRSVQIVHANALSAGAHRFEVDVSSWAAGTYIARVWNEGRQESHRFTVAR